MRTKTNSQVYRKTNDDPFSNARRRSAFGSRSESGLGGKETKEIHTSIQQLRHEIKNRAKYKKEIERVAGQEVKRDRNERKKEGKQ